MHVPPQSFCPEAQAQVPLWQVSVWVQALPSLHAVPLLAFGVDGMVTDRPDVLRALLEKKGMAVPPGLREHG